MGLTVSIALRGTGGTEASSFAAAASPAGPAKPLISWETTRRSESRRDVEDRRRGCLPGEVRGTHWSEKSTGRAGRAAGTAAEDDDEEDEGVA